VACSDNSCRWSCCFAYHAAVAIGIDRTMSLPRLLKRCDAVAVELACRRSLESYAAHSVDMCSISIKASGAGLVDMLSPLKLPGLTRALWYAKSWRRMVHCTTTGTLRVQPGISYQRNFHCMSSIGDTTIINWCWGRRSEVNAERLPPP
jgi:hypothetical protein